VNPGWEQGLCLEGESHYFRARQTQTHSLKQHLPT
jgi:hypothetical protein